MRLPRKMRRTVITTHETWKLEPDSYWIKGITGLPVATEVHNLIRGCEDMLKLPWPTLEQKARERKGDGGCP